MPRIQIEAGRRAVSTTAPLTRELADELKSGRQSGQPVIYEQTFSSSGKVRVTVIWDEWDHISLEDRTSIILQAYQSVLPDVRGRIALASGLTVPEASAAGMLPFRIITARRDGDPVTLEDCKKAMIRQGASTLISADSPQLRFATLKEAEAARDRLIKDLPESGPIWVISRDLDKVEDWLDFS